MTITASHVTTEPTTPEVVTHASTRLVRVPSPRSALGTVTVALITLNNGRDSRRPNTFGPQGLASLDAAISTAIDAAPDAIAITGKQGSFAAGADLRELARHRSRARPKGSPPSATESLADSGPHPSRPSRSSTAQRWAAAWNSRCTARYRTPLSDVVGVVPCPRCSSASCPVGADPAPAAHHRPGQRRDDHRGKPR